MPTYNRYYPDYEKMYPELKTRPDVLEVLRASDRKMKHLEYDIKAERFRSEQEKQIAVFIPSREDSIERIMSEEKTDYPDPDKYVEDWILRQERDEILHKAVSYLRKDERALIEALYFEEKTEAEYAQELGLSQKAVNKRRAKAIKNLKEILLRCFVESVLNLFL